MFSQKILLVLVLALALGPRDTVFSQTFNVHVLDALNGKPQAGFKVGYFCLGHPPSTLNSPEKTVVTGTSGIAQIPYDCTPDSEGMDLWVHSPIDKEYAKEECGAIGGLHLDKILSSGLISDPSGEGNIWCPRRISKTLKPVPGEVIIFVKKPTWWQVHVAG